MTGTMDPSAKTITLHTVTCTQNILFDQVQGTQALALIAIRGDGSIEAFLVNPAIIEPLTNQMLSFVRKPDNVLAN